MQVQQAQARFTRKKKKQVQANCTIFVLYTCLLLHHSYVCLDLENNFVHNTHIKSFQFYNQIKPLCSRELGSFVSTKNNFQILFLFLALPKKTVKLKITYFDHKITHFKI